jgi:hypothetical protein
MQNVANASKGTAAAQRIMRRLVGEGIVFSKRLIGAVPGPLPDVTFGKTNPIRGYERNVAKSCESVRSSGSFSNTETLRKREEILAKIGGWFRWDKKKVR